METGTSRIDAFVEVAELEHTIAGLYGGDGNRDYERTLGALDALKDIQKALALEENPHEEIKIGYIIKITRYLMLLGLQISMPGEGDDLHIGSKDGLQDQENELNRTSGPLKIRYEVIEEIEGTKAEILRAFIRYKRTQKYGS